MAGYVLKIVLEDTHPPVWRRVVIPERISFYELHLVIQCLFGWDNDHLHNFSIPSAGIFIEELEESGFWNARYPESETLVDQFFPDYKWIRYTYDFGDDWRHKIIFEKIDEYYKERYATLLKAKGNNFFEDAGDVWSGEEDEETRWPLDVQAVAKSLKKLVFSVHKDLDTKAKPVYSSGAEKRIVDEFFQKLLDYIDSAYDESSHKRESSSIALKIETLDHFYEGSLQQMEENDLEEPDYVLDIVPGTKSCAELLSALNLKEARDYCKYLQIPYSNRWTKTQMTSAVAQELCAHPEYVLYVLYEDEFREYLHLAGLPNGRLEKLPEEDTIIKAINMGLADFQAERRKGKTRAALSFATDITSLLRSLPAALRKQTYRDVKRFSERLKPLVLAYGMIDFDSLRSIFQSVYHTAVAPEDFCRHIYWHGRFNGLLCTLYRGDTGMAYAAAMQLDGEYVMARMMRYSKDLEYVSFSEKKLREMGTDIIDRSVWAAILCGILTYNLMISKEGAEGILEFIFPKVIEGRPLPVVIESILHALPVEPELSDLCELWNVLACMMLELELPMLKGRSRLQYAREKGTSAWDIDMAEEEKKPVYVKERHMYEFDRYIQETMFQAVNFAGEPDVKQLEAYLQKEDIYSEEFLYLLAKANISGGRFQEAGSLIRRLRKSSPRGKKGTEKLQEMLDEAIEAAEEPEKDNALAGDGRLPQVSGPYVRQTPKIGRNDPCPCGSGKKYKQCCGRGH